MRYLHVQYLRLMAASISYDGRRPFVQTEVSGGLLPMERSGFLEIEPAQSRFVHGPYPFAVMYAMDVPHQRDGHFRRRIANGTNMDDGPRRGTATQRYLRRQFRSLHTYRMDFWVQDPADDVLSDPRPVQMQEIGGPDVDAGPGIIDQCLQFVASLPWFQDGANPIRVTPGMSGIITDYAGELNAYKVFIEMKFEDGIYTIEERPTLDGAGMTIGRITL